AKDCDGLADAASIHAETLNVLHRARRAGLEHAISLHARERRRKSDGIISCLDHPANPLTSEKVEPGLRGLQRYGIGIPAIFRITGHERHTEVVQVPKENQCAAGRILPCKCAIYELAAFKIRSVDAQIIRWRNAAERNRPGR